MTIFLFVLFVVLLSVVVADFTQFHVRNYLESPIIWRLQHTEPFLEGVSMREILSRMWNYYQYKRFYWYEMRYKKYHIYLQKGEYNSPYFTFFEKVKDGGNVVYIGSIRGRRRATEFCWNIEEALGMDGGAPF